MEILIASFSSKSIFRQFRIPSDFAKMFMKILGIVGARPNFIKMAPVIAALKKHSGVETLLIHTGQHFNQMMSDIFFEELQLQS